MKNEPTKYIFAVGRRKTASATIRLYHGSGENTLNDKKLEEVYSNDLVKQMSEPLEVTENSGKFYFTLKTRGGGKMGQVDAIRLALSRALVKVDESFKPALKKKGFLTRDDRMVERKKAGLRKARKAPQYSKR